MLRFTSRLRPITTMLVGTIMVVAIACGGEAATPTSPPTSTSPPPTATAAMAATNTPVPDRDTSDLGFDAADLINHPGYDPAWGEPKYGGTLNFRSNVPIRTGSPFGSSGNSHYELSQMTTRDSLVKVDPWIGWSGGIHPALAKSWEMSADGLTYTFFLREGVFFRSANEWDKDEFADMPGRGQELTCEDVQSHMEFAGTERWWAEGGSLSNLIDTADHTWTCPDGPNGYTVVVTLDSGIPNPGLLMQMSIPGGFGITNKEWLEWVLENYPARWMRTGDWNAHVGTGAFITTELTPEIRGTVVANPNYWKKGLPFVDAFVFHTIPDPATAFAAWATGKIDIMGHGSGSMYPAQVQQAIRDFPEKPIYSNHYFGARAVAFNTERPPFDDARVRKAVHLVMNRQQWNQLQHVGGDKYAGIIAGFFNAQGQPYNAMGASIEEILTWPGMRPDKDADIAEANRLMDEVYGVGVRPGPFKCVSRADDTSTNACLFMGEMISTHLGMSLTLDLYDPATLTSQLNSCTWTFGVSTMPGWEGTPDPYLRYRTYNSDLQGVKPCLGGVDADLQSKVNGLIADMRRELDFNKRAEISKEIEFLLYNEFIPAAPMEWQNLFTGGQPWLKGYRVPDHAVHTGHVGAIERAWLDK